MGFDKDILELKKDLTPRKAIQFVAGTIVSLGATAAVVAAFKDPVNAAKGLTKWMMRLGIFVLGCKIGDMTEDYFNETIDDTIKAYEEAKEEMQKDGSESNE